jgi:hypothetical protein
LVQGAFASAAPAPQLAGPLQAEIDRQLESRLDQSKHRCEFFVGQAPGGVVAAVDVGELVDGEDPRVAQVLRRAGLLDVAHAAMHLDA